MTTEIATIETENQIAVMRDPEIVLKEAKKAAQSVNAGRKTERQACDF